MISLSVIFIGFYSAVVSLCLSARQVFGEPVPDMNFIVAQVALIGIALICIVIGARMQKKENKEEPKVVEFIESVVSASDDEYWAEIFKSNVHGGQTQMWVRVRRLRGGQEIFRSLLVDETYTESDVRQYLKLAKYLSRGGAPISYNKPQNRRNRKPIGDKQ